MTDSSSVDGQLENDDSEGCSSCYSYKKRKTSQKTGNFELLSGHMLNSHFNNDVKCHLEIFILVENKAHCKTLAKHLGLIWFEGLLEGEEHIESRLLRQETKMYKLAHTEIIKKMMKGYSCICVTPLESAWRFTSANVKGVVFTENSKFNSMSFKEEVNYCLLIDDNILRHIDAVSKIIQEYLLCNVEVPEKACTKINLPITVFIPLYIVKYFAQSFVATRKHCQNSKVVDIFQSKPIF